MITPEMRIAKIGQNTEVDGKRQKDQPKQRWLQQNIATDRYEPTPLLSEIKAEKEEEEL